MDWKSLLDVIRVKYGLPRFERFVRGKVFKTFRPISRTNLYSLCKEGKFDSPLFKSAILEFIKEMQKPVSYPHPHLPGVMCEDIPDSGEDDYCFEDEADFQREADENFGKSLEEKMEREMEQKFVDQCHGGRKI